MTLTEAERSRIFAAVLLLATFVTGVLAGVGIDRWAVRRQFRADARGMHGSWDGARHRGPRDDRGPGVQRLARELDLSAEQRATVDSLLARQRQRSRELQRVLRPQLDSLTEETHRELVAILTPEQRRRWEELQEEHRHWREDRRRDDERRDRR